MPDSASPVETAAAAGSPEHRSIAIHALSWEDLATAVRQCRGCDLYAGARHAVIGEGDRQADWLIVGEAPGAREDSTGRPFVGQSGRLLDQMLASLDLVRGENVFIGNVVKHRPPENRPPTPGEVAACLPYLERQIALMAPSIIVAFGKTAAQSLLRTGAGLGSLRGRVHDYGGIPLVVTYHPAYLLRRPPEKAKAREDLELARAAYLARQSVRTDSATRSGPL